MAGPVSDSADIIVRPLVAGFWQALSLYSNAFDHCTQQRTTVIVWKHIVSVVGARMLLVDNEATTEPDHFPLPHPLLLPFANALSSRSTRTRIRARTRTRTHVRTYTRRDSHSQLPACSRTVTRINAAARTLRFPPVLARSSLEAMVHENARVLA